MDLLQSDGEYSENQSIDMERELDEEDLMDLDPQTHFRKHNKSVTLNDRPSVLVFPEDRFALEDHRNSVRATGSLAHGQTATFRTLSQRGIYLS